MGSGGIVRSSIPWFVGLGIGVVPRSQFLNRARYWAFGGGRDGACGSRGCRDGACGSRGCRDGACGSRYTIYGSWGLGAYRDRCGPGENGNDQTAKQHRAANWQATDQRRLCNVFLMFGQLFHESFSLCVEREKRS